MRATTITTTSRRSMGWSLGRHEPWWPALLGPALCFGATTATTPQAAPTPNPAVGDTYAYRSVNMWNGSEVSRRTIVFQGRVDDGKLSFRATNADGGPGRVYALTQNLERCTTSIDIHELTCGGPLRFPMQIGQQHDYKLPLPNTQNHLTQTCDVEAYEAVTVPAGTFEAFRVACVGKVTTFTSDAIYRARHTETHWYAPSIQATIKNVVLQYAWKKFGLQDQTLTELVAFQPGGAAGAGPLDLATARTPAGPPDAAASAAMPGEFSVGGTRFAGQFVRDPGGRGYTGTGRVQWPNSDVYEGPLEHGVREGRARMVWASGQRYDGDWHLDLPQGQGTMHFVGGDVYDGRFDSGSPQGAGRMVYASGDRYEGDFDDGRPQGRGVYRWSDGQQLEGEWIDGESVGEGTMQFANGDRFEGELADGRPDGHGRMQFASGDLYVGSFKGGQPDGVGAYTWKGGAHYDGLWHRGLRHGRGVMTWADGHRWEGVFRDGERDEGGSAQQGGPAATTQ